MTNSFGPWTTAIDTGSSAQLSSFWKRRLSMLSIVGQCSPHVARRGRLLLASIAAIALAVPTLYLSRTVAATEEKAEVGQPFRVTLPHGIVVDVLGVGHHPSHGKAWWAPDGTPAAAPYKEIDGMTQPWKSELTREIAIRWIQPTATGYFIQGSTGTTTIKGNGGPDFDVTLRWWPAECSSAGATLVHDEKGNVIKDVAVCAAAFRNTLKTCTLKFEVSAEPWETLRETDGRSSSSYGDKKYGFAFSPAYQQQGSVGITISHNLSGRDIRVVAVGRAGKEIVADKIQSAGAKDFVQTTAVFSGISLEDIQLFRLQARNYQKVEVRDIALYPGQAAKPHMVVMDPQGR
jgi:hypothetical protein